MHQTIIKQSSNNQTIIEHASNMHRTIIKLSSNYHQTIIKLSSDNHQTIIKHASNNHQTIIKLSSNYHQTIIKLSSNYHQTIIKHASNMHQTCIKLYHPTSNSKRLPSPGLHTILEPPRPQQHLPHLRLPRCQGLGHLRGAVERPAAPGEVDVGRCGKPWRRLLN